MRILSEFERVVQSNHTFKLDDSVTVIIIHVEIPIGGTGSKRSEINLEKHLAKKKSIIRIQNTDQTCLALALVVSMAKIKNEQCPLMIKHQRSTPGNLAYDLHQKAGVPSVWFEGS